MRRKTRRVGTTQTLGEFADLGAEDLAEGAAAAALDVLGEVVVETAETYQQKIPRESGDMRRATRVAIKDKDAQGVKVDQAASVAARLDHGDVAITYNLDPGVNTIDRGRARLSNGKMGGSNRAPHGIARPTVHRVNARFDQIAQRALDKAEI